jgi:hypothetical protein
MIRSMSNAQIEAAEVARHGVRFDKEPWVIRGTRVRTAIEHFDGKETDYLPRPECIPSPDPLPWQNDFDNTRLPRYPESSDINWFFVPRPWGTFTPDPEFVRSEVNPILSQFRDRRKKYPSESILNAGAIRLAIGHITNATPEQVESARKVLSRLRDVMEASK